MEASSFKIEERAVLPYPNGWFVLCCSREIKPGAVLTVPFIGSQLVVYRTESGDVRVCQPYCPHLGAHLGHGGRVEGENLVCPFHGFAYDKDGACVYACAGHKPPKISLKQMLVREINGMVYVWYHDCGLMPDWAPPILDLHGFVCTSVNKIDMRGYVQDMGENTADTTHLQHVHGWRPGVRLTPLVSDGPRISCVLTQFYQLDLPLSLTLHGLGTLIAEGKLPKFGVEFKMMLVQTQTGPLEWNVRHLEMLRMTKPRLAPEPVRRMLGHLFVSIAHRYNARTLDQDKRIFTRRSYQRHPGLCALDGPMAEFRRWAQQFYPSAHDRDATISRIAGRVVEANAGNMPA